MTASRPQLSSNYIDDFYRMLEHYSDTSKLNMEFLKKAFYLYIRHPEYDAEDYSVATGYPRETCDIVIDNIVEMINTIQAKDTKPFAPLTIIQTRPPREYKYTDQHGKKWLIVNEFFGI